MPSTLVDKYLDWAITTRHVLMNAHMLQHAWMLRIKRECEFVKSLDCSASINIFDRTATHCPRKITKCSANSWSEYWRSSRRLKTSYRMRGLRYKMVLHSFGQTQRKHPRRPPHHIWRHSQAPTSLR